MTRRRSKRGLGEFELIERLFSPLATSPAALGLRDDVALLRVRPRHELVLSADAIVEGVHFFSSDPPASIAQKALRVNLSDLAAKGAGPLGYLMTLALPAGRRALWLKRFASGLARDQRQFSIPLLGGDTTRTGGPVTVAITVLGQVRAGRLIKRGGAHPGDLVFVSGTVGDAGAGLAILKAKRAPEREVETLVSRFRLPIPRLSIGVRLVGVANSAIDVSDGLIADLGHISDVSHVRIVLDAGRIPLSAALRNRWGRSETAVIRAATSGDDYEIAFTCAPARAQRVASIARETGVAITEIGRVTRGTGVVVQGARGQVIRLPRAGYTHF